MSLIFVVNKQVFDQQLNVDSIKEKFVFAVKEKEYFAHEDDAQSEGLK